MQLVVVYLWQSHEDRFFKSKNLTALTINISVEICNSFPTKKTKHLYCGMPPQNLDDAILLLAKFIQRLIFPLPIVNSNKNNPQQKQTFEMNSMVRKGKQLGNSTSVIDD